MADHLADDGSDLGGVELEHFAEGLDGEGVVEGGVGEEVCSQTLLLDLLGEHLLDLLGIGHQIPDLDAVDEADRLLPLTSGESLGGLHDVVSGVLRGSGEDLSLVVLQHAAVGLADDTLPNVRRRAGLGQERNLQEHAAGQVNTLEQLEVNMHVEGQLALLLQALLLGRDLAVSLHHDTLSEQLLLAAAAANLLQGVLSIVDEALAEGAETDLDESSVVQDLALDVEAGDSLLQVRHEHHVTSLVVVVVQGEEVDLGEQSSGTEDALAVGVKVGAEDVDQLSRLLSTGTRGGGGVDVLADGLPAVLLKGLDDLSRLSIKVSMNVITSGAWRASSYLEVDVL